MKVIKSMEVIEVAGDQYSLTSLLNDNLYRPLPVQTAKGTELMTVEAVTEIIRGRRFQTPKGNIVIGLTQEVSEILDIHYEAWRAKDKLIDEQSQQIYELTYKGRDLELQNVGYKLKLDELTEASLWTRIKWIFRGIK